MKKSIYQKPESIIVEIEVEGILQSTSRTLTLSNDSETDEGSKTSASYRQNLWD